MRRDSRNLLKIILHLREDFPPISNQGLSLSLPPSVSLPVCLSHDTGLPAAACSALSFAVINEERWLRSFEIPINLSFLPSHRFREGGGGGGGSHDKA